MLAFTAALSLAAAPALAFPKLSLPTFGAPPAPATAPALVPAPAQMTPAAGVFVLKSGQVIAVPRGDVAARATAAYLADLLKRTRGLTLTVRDDDGTPAAVRLVRAPSQMPGDEAYDLSVTPAGAVITAAGDAGLFYGEVSLWQLADATDGRASEVAIKAVSIHDAPRYAWRGLLLDSARHFQSVAFVERFIDVMALHKMNVLHWHLSDDQAWRLEIKKYPRLTSVGAWRVPAGQGPREDIDPKTGRPRLYGGFYTQDQAREVVAYAAARHVTVVPEFDMPGHATAAIAAYPELASTPTPPKEVSSDWGIFPNLYNTDDHTIAFLQDVLGEVIEIFPSKYIHVGGDEAVKDQWKASPQIQAQMKALGVKDEEGMQSWFTGRMDAFLTAHGRRLVGWDDILKGGLTPNAVVMSWQGPKGAAEAAAQNHDAILAVDPTLYLDHRQGSSHDQPPGRGAVLTLKDVHDYESAPPVLTAAQQAHVLGVEGAVWTEHISTEDRTAFMAFPRAAAIAELGWSPHGNADWPGFLARMPAEVSRYRALDFPAADSAFEPLVKTDLDASANRVTVSLATQTGLGDIHYSLDGRAPSPVSPKYTAPITVDLPARLRTQTFDGARPISAVVERRLDPIALRERDSTELRTCSGKLDLALEDDAPAKGPRATFLVDILQPCWIYPKADMDGITVLTAEVGQLPYNFQIGDLINQIKFRAPATPEGELEVRLDACDGERIAVMPLKPAVANQSVTALPPVTIKPITGKHDLCFTFTQAKLEPMWVIKTVGLRPAGAPAPGVMDRLRRIISRKGER
jgi:hexosaminidase